MCVEQGGMAGGRLWVCRDRDVTCSDSAQKEQSADSCGQPRHCQVVHRSDRVSGG